MALSDYLKSGWIAGLDPNSVQVQNLNGFDTASGIAKTDQWNFRVEVVALQWPGLSLHLCGAHRQRAVRPGRRRHDQELPRGVAGAISSRATLSIKTVVAGPVDTADSLARKMGPVTDATNLFYILNNLYPGDPVTPGAAYKVVAIN